MSIDKSSFDLFNDSPAVFPFNREIAILFEGFKKEDAMLSFKGVASLSESVTITKSSS